MNSESVGVRPVRRGDVIERDGKHFVCTGETADAWEFKRLSASEARELEIARAVLAREYPEIHG
jgi:hypothetical protein